MININEMYNKLKEEVVNSKGYSIFTLNNISVKMKSRDSIGNLLQDWLEKWFDENSIKYKTLPNSQEFPDYILYFEDETPIYLEVKSWNFNASPAFDLANFEAYIDMIEETPQKLLAKYLVFTYSISTDGEICIENVFLKNIWELTGPSKKRPLTVQVKRDVIYNIRPKNFTNKELDLFETPQEFLSAVKEQMNSYNKEKKDMDNWITHITDKLNL